MCIRDRDGLIATEGRKKFSHYNAMAVASNMKAMGIESVIYTDILRRGLYNGAGIMPVSYTHLYAADI